LPLQEQQQLPEEMTVPKEQNAEARSILDNFARRAFVKVYIG
jgi:hypothetical protein